MLKTIAATVDRLLHHAHVVMTAGYPEVMEAFARPVLGRQHPLTHATTNKGVRPLTT